MAPSQPPQINLANLRQASRDPVIDALTGFAGAPTDQWLLSTHRARAGQFLTHQGNSLTNFQTFQGTYSGQQIAEVLAATAPNHCLDGWTYLSRALAALLAGDAHSARHLAYYAQLRAALSILGCNGIGIFNSLNFAIDATKNVHRIDTSRLGTHKAAWEVLQTWTADSHAAHGFLESIEFRSVSLADCIDALWPSTAPAPLAEQVISAWGVDLMRAADDRESRNISSYAPHALNPLNFNLPTRLELIHDLWLCLEPDARGGFPLLDRHLLRRFLELMKTQQSKITPQRHLWRDRYSRLDPTIQAFVSREFLQRLDEPDDPIIFTHAYDTTVGNVHAMICRAVLLLRTATSVVRTALVDAGFEPLPDSVRPWFEPVGVDRGFWSTNQQPDEISDLWDDVNAAVSDLSRSIASSPADQLGFLDTLTARAVFLTQTERACMWAVCA